MVKKSPEKFTEWLDRLSDAGTVKGASRASGLSARQPTRWLKWSRADEADGREDSEYFFSYHGEMGWLHEHEAAVLQSLLHEITHGAVIRARDGSATVAMVDGQVIYQQNPDWDPRTPGIQDMDEDTLRMLDFPTRYLYTRDEEGKFHKVPSIVRAAPSNELTLAMLAAYSKRFAKRMSVDHQHNVSGGVLIASRQNVSALPQPVQTIDPVSEAITEGVFEEQTAAEEKREQNAAPAPAPARPPRVDLTPLQADLIEQARRKGLPT